MEELFFGDATIFDSEGADNSVDDGLRVLERILGRRFHDRKTLLQVDSLRFLGAASSLGAMAHRLCVSVFRVTR